ncbi:ADOP family duplicated permease [Luteitalea sp.]|uniref:ADOP family duplicated permease n=1 Tax=Luteitalea sp. TaxID=2004800 RepID=UPI0025B9EAC3|nr:ADOP family duplicated permease [Luteitalea sp.]
MSASLKFYRLLIKLYPANFREQFGTELERQFRDDYQAVRRRRDVARLWLWMLADFLISMPTQIAREVWQDTRHALRIWRRSPIHTAVAVVVLAVAVGANTAAFSVLNALLLRALPFHDPSRLAILQNFGPPRDEFHTWRQQSAYLADAALHDTFDVNVDGVDVAQRLRLTETSSNFFSMLGRPPALGRAFLAGEDVAGRTAVAVISYGIWQRLFGGDALAVGSTLRVNGTALTVVGIAPPDFDYPQHTEIWTPTTFDFERIPKTGAVMMWTTVGRLKGGVSWAAARQAFEAEAVRRDPSSMERDAVNRPALVPLQTQLAGHVRNAALLLMAGVALLLLLACANLANLLLARTVSRSNELMIRTALGASRARLTQQLLTETLLLSFIAATVGLLIARWAIQVVGLLQPPQLVVQAYALLDVRVLAFCVLLSVATGLIFGVGPALYATRAALRPGGRTATAGARHARARAVLVAAQVAITVVLLTASASLGRAFFALVHADSGYDVRSVATLNVSLAGTPYEDNASASGYYEEVLRRVRQVPGVDAASGTQSLPLNTDAFAGGRFNVDGKGPLTIVPTVNVWPGFFRTMGGRVIAGREFSSDELLAGDGLVLVNDAFARLFGEPASLLGRAVTAEGRTPMPIIGVVRGLRYGAAVDEDPQIFTVSRAPRAMTIVAKVRGAARDRLEMIREAAQSVDRRVPIFDAKTMEQRLEAVLARPKFYATAVTFFGGLGLLLAVVGIYGIVSFNVSQQTREMGIRLALGTTPGQVRRAVLGRTLLVVSAGAVVGLVVVRAEGEQLRILIAGADAGVPAVSFMVVIGTTLVAGAAAWLASRRITSLDIADVLRPDGAQ